MPRPAQRSHRRGQDSGARSVLMEPGTQPQTVAGAAHPHGRRNDDGGRCRSHRGIPQLATVYPVVGREEQMPAGQGERRGIRAVRRRG